MVFGGWTNSRMPADSNRVEREFLKSGYCVKCQKLLFDNGETDRLY